MVFFNTFHNGEFLGCRGPVLPGAAGGGSGPAGAGPVLRLCPYAAASLRAAA